MSNERDFLKQVVQLAQMYGWLCGSHDKSARKVGNAWISNITGDKGEPDLRMVRPPRMICAELKTGKTYGGVNSNRGGRYGLTADQKRWQEALEAVPGVEYFVWQPEDLSEIARVLAK